MARPCSYARPRDTGKHHRNRGCLSLCATGTAEPITISSGPDGSVFRSVAEKYRAILARNGIRLEILPSDGSLDNLRRLTDANVPVDVGFVQGGVATGSDISNVVSLGSLFYEPLVIVYRNKRPIQRLSDLRGKRIAIGPEGSGTRFLALALLKANEIQPDGTNKATRLGGGAGDRGTAQTPSRCRFPDGRFRGPGDHQESGAHQGCASFQFFPS